MVCALLARESREGGHRLDDRQRRDDNPGPLPGTGLRSNRAGPVQIRAIDAAVGWLRAVEIRGWRLERRDAPGTERGFDNVLVPDRAAPPLWARFYEIGTNRPMYVGRDGVVRDKLSDIEYERRTGYSYIGPYADRLLADEYPAWQKRVASGPRAGISGQD